MAFFLQAMLALFNAKRDADTRGDIDVRQIQGQSSEQQAFFSRLFGDLTSGNLNASNRVSFLDQLASSQRQFAGEAGQEIRDFRTSDADFDKFFGDQQRQQIEDSTNRLFAEQGGTGLFSSTFRNQLARNFGEADKNTAQNRFQFDQSRLQQLLAGFGFEGQQRDQAGQFNLAGTDLLKLMNQLFATNDPLVTALSSGESGPNTTGSFGFGNFGQGGGGPSGSGGGGVPSFG